jgi:hypothetical protein
LRSCQSREILLAQTLEDFMKFALVALFLASATSALAADPHCQPMDSPLQGQKAELCIYPGEKNADVLYFLHGMNENAEMWGQQGFFTEQLRAYWKAHGEAAPTVVSVSFGEVWLLGPKTTAPYGFGSFDLFTDKVMPMIEAKLGGIKGRRLLLGDSMGGFNSLQLGMKTDLFVKVAALCAPMGDGNVGPFSSDAEVAAGVRPDRNRALSARPAETEILPRGWLLRSLPGLRRQRGLRRLPREKRNFGRVAPAVGRSLRD